MVSSLILGGIVGLLLGLLICYWKTLHAVYEQKDLIGSGVALGSAASDFVNQLRKL